jgi:hypothetical protein
MNLAIMLLIDKQFLDTPFYGVQQMTWHLKNEGHPVNFKRIRRLMRLMRLMPIFQKPDTSRPAKGHKTYPYLFGGLRVDQPIQVWCADITYLPTPVAVPEVRVRLPPRLRDRIGATGWPWPVDHLLQHPASALGPGRENPSRGL